MSNFKSRLNKEYEELSDKIYKLETFLQSESFLEIDEAQQSLLTIQFESMSAYRSCLKARINLLNQE